MGDAGRPAARAPPPGALAAFGSMTPNGPEQALIMHLFRAHYPTQCGAVARDTGTWVPEWSGGATDPSGRAIAAHHAAYT